MAWGPRGEPEQVTITLYPTRNLFMPRRSVREGGGWRRTIPCSMSGGGSRGSCWRLLRLHVRLAPVVVVPVMVPTAAADRHRHKDAGLRSEGNCQEQQRDPQIAHGAPPTTWDRQKGSSIPARR